MIDAIFLFDQNDHMPPLFRPALLSALLPLLEQGVSAAPTTPHAAGSEHAQANAPEMVAPADMLARLVAEAGDTRRLREKLVAAAESGSPLRVGFIGGSVTLGDGPDRYATVIVRRLCERLRGPVQEINAGIGGTGSDFASFRAAEDLLRAAPDIVFVEFAVNDPATPAATTSMEALIRQLLVHPARPAVVLLGMLKQDGANAQNAHLPVARHYALPFLSVRDALWPAFSDGRLVWADFYRDSVHPANPGHALIGALVGGYLENVLASPPPSPSPTASPAPRAALPDPLVPSSANFATTSMLDASGKNSGVIRLVKNAGWTIHEKSRHGPAWVSDAAGAELRFEFEGNVVALLVHRAMENAGDIEASVDGGPFRLFSLRIPYKLMDNSHVIPLADSLPNGAHTLVVRHAAPADASPAARVELRRIMSAAKEGSR